MKHFDGKAKDTNSFYNISTLFACGQGVTYTCEGTDTFTAGTKDFLTGVSNAAANNGTAAGTIGSNTASFQVKGYEYTDTQGGWATLQTGATRDFAAATVGNTIPLTLQVGDTVTFKAGFK